MKKFFYIVVMLSVCLSCSAKPRHYRVKVVAEYPHDASAYTQGLFWHGGKLYESTGLEGRSSFRIVDLQTGRPQKKFSFDRKYFVEGSTILGDKLYILTWQSNVLFIYNAKTLEYEQTFSYPREGWGLTTDGKSLVASDGSDKLYFLSPSLQLERSISVKLDGKPVKYLNELEWIDGKIWANVYTTDYIMIINPSTGNVEGVVDCTGLLPDKYRNWNTDVLNGIARNPADGRIYLTGKNWKRLYEIILEEKK